MLFLNIVLENYSIDFFLGDETIFESEYLRERTVVPPIGMPMHCYTLTQSISSTPPSNLAQNFTTNFGKNSQLNAIPKCPSSCNIDSPLKHTPEILEIPELSIPENVDLVDQNITSMQQINVETNKQQTEFVNNITVQINYNSPESLNIPIVSSSNKLAVGDNNDEQPIEVRDYPITNTNSNTPIEPDLKRELHETSAVKITEPAADGSNKGTGILPEAYSTSTPKPTPANTNESVYLESKIVNGSLVNERTDIYEEPKVNTIGSHLNPIAAVAVDSACIIVQIIIRAISFNTTLGSDLICPQSGGGTHSFNITYNVPLSKYMKEDVFELIFV